MDRQLVGDRLRHVARPALGGVEGHDPDRVGMLAVQGIADHCLPVRSLFVGLRPCAAQPFPKIVEHQVDIAIFRLRHN